jgi:hypothetical protein
MKKLVIALALVSSSAFAGQAINFESLKLACQNPGKFQNQIAPKNIQVTCQDVQYKWIPEASGAVNLPTGRAMTVAVSSDKYTVNPTSTDLKTVDQVAACPKYSQVAEMVSFSKAVTCDELVNFPGSGAEFCTILIDDVRNTNPEAIRAVSTGKTVDFCSARAGQKPGQGQGQK